VPHVLDGKGFARPMTQREIHIASGKIRIDDDGNEVEMEFAPPLEEHPLYKKHKDFYGAGMPEEEADERHGSDDGPSTTDEENNFFARRDAKYANETSEDER
jgi:hypothetical protein